MTKLNLFELAKVTGGELDEGYKTYFDVIIVLCKMAGTTLEELLVELRAAGRTQEMLDYVIANW